MNRGEMTIEVRDLVESYLDDIGYPRLNRAIQRAAGWLHDRFCEKSSALWTTRTFDFTGVNGTRSYELTGVYDFRRPRRLYRNTPYPATPTTRRIDICYERDDAAIIAEIDRFKDQYRRGVDNFGRAVAYFKPSPEGGSAIHTITITGSPTTGHWVVGFGGQTANINLGASLLEVRQALEGLSTVGLGNIASVIGTVSSRYVVTFGGTLGYQDLDLITVDVGTLDGGAAVAVEETRAGASIGTIEFVGDPLTGPLTLLYDRLVTKLNPDDLLHDALVYDTIPESSHAVLCRKAAVDMLGKRLEPNSDLASMWAMDQTNIDALMASNRGHGQVQRARG